MEGQVVGARLASRSMPIRAGEVLLESPVQIGDWGSSIVEVIGQTTLDGSMASALDDRR